MTQRTKRFVIGTLLIVAVVGFAGSGFLLGYRFGENNPKLLVVRGVTNLESGEPGAVDFSTFWQAWSTINENYLRDADISNQDRVYGAIRGLVGSLQDPYSEFFTPTENEKFQADVRGDFGGIGAEMGMKKNQLVIIAPLKDSPAMRAGLKPGDAVLKINASSTDGLSLDEAVTMIRGPKGSAVTLNIYRDGFKEPKDFTIVRDTIVVPTVDFEMKDGGVAYVQIHSFNANLDRLFYDAVAKALADGARGMVLDLRNDPGGYLDVAVDIAGWFLPRGAVIVSEATRNTPQVMIGTTATSGGMTVTSNGGEVYYAEGNAALAQLPVVVLINQGTASAAEILAGALRDNRHAKLVGEQSFGKGTVQDVSNLNDGSTLKLTIAHWVLPGGQVLENGGLKPDIEVKAPDENSSSTADPQLEKAIEVIKQVIR